MSLPKGWKKVKFGELAEERSKRVDNPSESGFDRYVGLEHLDSGSLVVKRWGSTKDVTSAMKLFKEGDILFARRNTYLRRVSVAQFDGVCSGDIIVLQPILKQIVKDFLPIFMQFEDFENRVISLSAGAFSKRIKWKQLAEEYVFTPSIDEQNKIVKLIWLIQKYLQKIEISGKKVNEFKDGILNNMVANTLNRKDKTLFRLSDCMAINPRREIKIGQNTKFVAMDDLKEKSEKITGYVNRDFKGGGSKFKNYDTLMARITPCLENGKTAFVDILNDEETAVGSTEFIVLSGKEKITLNKFVYYICISPYVRQQAINSMIGTSGRQRVPNSFFKTVSINIPSIEEQKRIINVLDRLNDYYLDIKALSDKSNKLKKKLTDEFLSGRILLK